MNDGPSVRDRTFWALVALAGATRLIVALADYRSLIGTDVFPDDAFYYLRIAANVVDGRGLTFDGAAPTNGFQPLYLLMLLPIMAATRGHLVLPIHLSAVLLTAWAVATAVVLHALLSRLAGRAVALFGLVLWAVCPYFILMSVNGLETGVAIFFALLVPLLTLAWFRGDRPPNAARALAFGCACGLAVLARIDLILLIAAVAIVGASRPRPLSAWRPALAAAGLALAGGVAIWLPWGLISHAATGHWLPLSGAASRQIALDIGWLSLQPIWPGVSSQLQLFDPGHVPASYYADVATKLAFVFMLESPLLAPLRANVPAGPWATLQPYLPYRLFWSHPPLGAVIALATGAAIVVAYRRAAARVVESTPSPRTVMRRVLGVYLLLTAIGYTFYSPAHWYFNRYLASALVLSTIVVLAEVDHFRLPALRGRGRSVTALLALAIVACQLGQWRFAGRLRWSDAPAAGFLASWNTLGPRVGPTDRLGAFQAGIYGYFSGHDVVNLDGKVNQDALAALQNNRVHDYIRAQRIRWIIDSDWMLQALCARHVPPGGMSFRPVAAAGGGSSVRLFEVIDAR